MAASARQLRGMSEAAGGNPGRIHSLRRSCATKLAMEKTMVRVNEVTDIHCSGDARVDMRMASH